MFGSKVKGTLLRKRHLSPVDLKNEVSNGQALEQMSLGLQREGVLPAEDPLTSVHGSPKQGDPLWDAPKLL